MSRAPIDTSGGRPTTTAELETALGIVRRSGVLAVLGPRMDHDVGRPSTLSLLGFLVAAQLNGLRRHHQGHLVEIARVLNALTDDQRHGLGLLRWDPEEAYHRVERLFLRLCSVLETRFDAEVDGRMVRVEAGWFADRLAAAAIPLDLRASTAVAVDGTDLETWGALRGDAITIDLDGEAAETQPLQQESGAAPGKRRRPARRAKVLGVGPDGRKVYTADPDARAGHRSTTNSRQAGPYVGYELHLGVQTRDVHWTNHVDKAIIGPEVAGVITTFSLVAAGSHRAASVVPNLLRAKCRPAPR